MSRPSAAHTVDLESAAREILMFRGSERTRPLLTPEGGLTWAEKHFPDVLAELAGRGEILR